ncbi:MAG: helix-turn-helix transcriptional regulator [Lachnospiraceae bacterium]|nr:helix-turn-helix transcriptional regulator [Lachnospiraceae bacterium]
MSRASTSDAKEIGSKIKFFRKQKHWTQEVLAHKVGTSTAAICVIERGERVPGTELLCRIAKALGHKLSDFEPESVYNNSVCESEIDEVLSNIKHTYMGLDPEKQAFMLKQLEMFDGTYVLL